MPISRRNFIRRIAAAGGLGLAFATMRGLGHASDAYAQAAPVLPPDHGRGTHIAVLGAGIAGLALTYQLERAGFQVTLLEARDRLGGRNWTVRNGSKIEMVGEADQTARLSEGLYFNAGPARIPSHHQGLLEYCRILGVPLEVEVNASRSALIQSDQAFGGRPIQQRQAINDLRGRISELLAKALNRHALDQDLSARDRERLIAFLRNYGDLNGDLAFERTTRSGYRILPGAADQVGVARDPLPLGELLGDPQLSSILFDENIVMQATMFEPVGGMDRIPAGFERAIRSPVLRGAEVRRIRHDAAGVDVDYRDRPSGAMRALHADYVVVTVPLTVLRDLDTDFSAPVKAAIAGAVYDHSAKVAFESPRFWEREQIYGGLSFGGVGTGVVWYPSSGFQSDRGLLVGAYVSGPAGAAFEALPIARQIEMARATVDRLHPGHGADLTNPLVVDWNRIPFNLGPWVHWGEDAADQAAYRLLNQPDGRVYFSGAHLSQLPSWQEGAVFAAHRTVGDLAARVRMDRTAR